MPTDALQKLLETGLLGILLVIAFGAIFYLYKEVGKERIARLEDLKEMWQLTMKHGIETENTLRIILEILKKP